MNQSIYLVGPMASGKSVVAAELSRLLDLDLIDTDAEMVRHHGPISEIFTRLGEPGMRDIEEQTLAAADDAASLRPTVVSTGGGVVVRERNRRLLAQRFTVYLLTDLEHVRPRLLAGAAHRPLLAGDPVGRWQDILAERSALYEECSQLVVDTRGHVPADIAQTIADAYRRRAATHEGSH